MGDGGWGCKQVHSERQWSRRAHAEWACAAPPISQISHYLPPPLCCVRMWVCLFCPLPSLKSLTTSPPLLCYVPLQVDVWALGVLTVECLTGHAPFHGESDEDVLRSIEGGWEMGGSVR